MTRALVWKELRGQWAIWLTLVLAAAGGTAGLCALLTPSRLRDEALFAILCGAGWIYGLLCGALLLAGEVEDGTQGFLDILPATRRRLWQIKAATGLGLLAAQLLALVGIGLVTVRVGYMPIRPTEDVVGMLFLAVTGYAWGLFCGSFASNVLRAVGLASLLFVLSGILLVPILAIPQRAFAIEPSSTPVPILWVVAVSVLAFGAGTRSRAVYSFTDRQRERRPRRRSEGLAQPGWNVLLWLAWTQARGFALGMGIFGAVGMGLVAFVPVVGWPLITMFVGVLCGVTAFADEQRSGAFSVVGDQRFPLGRFWLVRVAVRLAIGLGVTALIGIGAALVIGVRKSLATPQELQSLGSGILLVIMPIVETETLHCLTLWLFSGFSVGVFFGLLIRKPIVASIVAVVVACPLTLAWLPSMIAGGGLHLWQVWGVPALLLIASRMLIQPAAAGRLFPGPAFRVSIAVATASLLWLAAALSYRIAEIPLAPDVIDVEAFKAGFPTVEENRAGQLAAAGLSRLAEFQRTIDSTPPPLSQALVAERRPPELRPSATYLAQANDVLERGWQPGDAALGAFLDHYFADSWAKNLAESADKPRGVVEDPRTLTTSSLLPNLQNARDASTLLGARSLQMQHDGDPAAFVNNLRFGLALGRNLRHKTIIISVLVGTAVDTQMVRGVERWLKKLDGRPDLLRQVLEILLRQEREPFADSEEMREAEFLVMLNTVADPRNLVGSSSRNDPFAVGPLGVADLLGLSWQVPWERIRLRRRLESLASGDRNVAESAWSSSPRLLQVSFAAPHQTAFNPKMFPAPRTLCNRRIAILQVALRLYQSEVGKPAENLADLVPHYLVSIPADPFDGQPIRYRLSRGEVLNWLPAVVGGEEGVAAAVVGAAPAHLIWDRSSTRTVPAGQGILWCVGADGRDDGGHSQQTPHPESVVLAEDVISLVPLPPGKR